jgi:hypothetical protein
VSERYKVKKVAHYEVVENHQNLVNAQEAIQAAAVQVSDSGDGEDAVG